MSSLHEDVCAFMMISRRVLLRMKSVSFQVVEKIKTHVLYSITFFSENHAFIDNVEKCGRAGQARLII
jgi:hypothetical protein